MSKKRPQDCAKVEVGRREEFEYLVDRERRDIDDMGALGPADRIENVLILQLCGRRNRRNGNHETFDRPALAIDQTIT
ncbi:MAG: hypothetical protein IPO18_02875 [bacterium]|nr:hypothetical protein [bacterium]MBK9471216.1 hypothetical protein [bacterium]